MQVTDADDNAPTLTITSDDTSLTDGEAANITFTFSEAVSGFTDSDISITGGALSAISTLDGGVTYTAGFLPTDPFSGLGTISVADDTYEDLQTNLGTGDALNLNILTVEPTVNISITDSTLTVGETTVVTFTFNEPVQNFDLADVTVENGTITGLATTDNIVFTATFTPTTSLEDFSNIISVGTGYEDISGNTGSSATSTNYVIDSLAPTVAIAVTDTTLTAGETTAVAFTFSEQVSNFDISDISADNGAISGLSTADNIKWTATFTPSADVEDVANTISVGSAYLDQRGNTGSPGVSVNYIVSTGVDDGPAVVNSGDGASGAEDTVINNLLQVTDPDGGETFALNTGASNGTAVIDAAGNWSYTPVADFNGADSFVVTVTDGEGFATDITINVTVLPVVDIANDSVSTTQDTPVTDSVTANDTFEGAVTYSFSATGANGGTITDNGSGSYTYTPPNAGFTGTDSFTVTITSPAGVTETSSVTVTVDPIPVVDDGPAVVVSGNSGATLEDNALTDTLVVNDVDGLAASPFSLTAPPANGTAVIDPTTGQWTYTPTSDFNGSDNFTVRVTDGDGFTTDITINVTVNPVADAVNDSIVTDEDVAITASVLNDNFEGPATYTINGDAVNGTVVDNGNGSFTYTPNANFSGVDSFSVTITAGGVTESSVVNVTVNPVVDISAGADSLTVDQDTVNNSGQLELNDSTTSGGALSFAKSTDPSNGTVTVNANGNFLYTPNPGFAGPDSFSYIVTDSTAGETATEIVSITVNAVAPPPHQHRTHRLLPSTISCPSTRTVQATLPRFSTTIQMQMVIS